MKALTLWQPWASLIAWGEKQYETRSWPTEYRGLLAIHAGKSTETQDLYELHLIYRQVLFARNGGWAGLPASAVLCIARLIDVVPTAERRGRISSQEEAFGDWSSGRFAWELEVVELFPSPIPANGKQGLWNWERP